MLYLVCAILSSSATALLLKYSEIRGQNRYVVTSLNYFMAALVSLAFVLASPTAGHIPGNSSAFSNEFMPVLTGIHLLFSLPASLIWASVVGIFGGICYCAGFLFIQRSIRENGVGLTGAFSKLGILLPMTFALCFWKEVPTMLQATGIVLAVLSILLLNLSSGRRTGTEKASASTLLLLLLSTGLGDFMGKLFEKYGRAEAGTWFLLVLFATALAVSLSFTVKSLRNGAKFERSDVLMGLGVGIPNLLTTVFLIQAFGRVKTTLVFPLFASGAIFLITLGGIVLFREHLRNREAAAIVMIIGSVVMMGT